MHVQSVQKYCFSLANMQICGVFVAVAVVVAYAPYWKKREFKIYDATVAKTSLKIASSSFSIYFVIMSVCLTFEN